MLQRVHASYAWSLRPQSECSAHVGRPLQTLAVSHSDSESVNWQLWLVTLLARTRTVVLQQLASSSTPHIPRITYAVIAVKLGASDRAVLCSVCTPLNECKIHHRNATSCVPVSLVHSNLFTKSTPAADSSTDAVRRLLLSKETIVITMWH